MVRVLHIRDTYLRATETFIYDIFTRMTGVEAHFGCERTDNLELFPALNLHVLADSGTTSRIYNEATRRLEHRFPFYDELVEEICPDVIHAHFGPSGYFSLSAAKICNAALITSFYGQDVFEVPSKARWKRRYKTLFDEGDLFLALSEDMKRDLVGMGCAEEKIQIYRLGIDLSDFGFLKHRKPVAKKILTIARLVEKKGIEYLIRAYSEVRKSHDVVLEIVGDGPLRQQLEELAAELGVADFVEFSGTVPFNRLPEVIADADIFCLPSVVDSFGGKDEISMVLKEALAMGVPIVTTYHAGIPEVIDDGVNGILTPECDVAALASALSQLITDEKLRKVLAAEGRNLVERVWDIEKQTALLREIYTEAAGKKQGDSL